LVPLSGLVFGYAASRLLERGDFAIRPECRRCRSPCAARVDGGRARFLLGHGRVGARAAATMGSFEILFIRSLTVPGIPAFLFEPGFEGASNPALGCTCCAMCSISAASTPGCTRSRCCLLATVFAIEFTMRVGRGAGDDLSGERLNQGES